MPKLLIIIGLVFIILGLVWQFAPWLLNWFGKLPGDINVQNSHSRVFIPFTSMAIISIAVSLIIKLFTR